MFATTSHSGRALISLAALTAAATLAERFPVPINAETGGGVLSLTFVFAVAAIVLFGWAAGALLLLAATAIVQLAQHRPFQRIAFNVAVLALVALAAGALIAPIHGQSVGAVVARVVLAATADNVVNIVLISAAIALSSGQPYLRLMQTHIRATVVPFAFMASAALDARRPLGTLTGPFGRPRRTTARDCALPALDPPRAACNAAGAHRSVDRTRQSPPLPRASPT